MEPPLFCAQGVSFVAIIMRWPSASGVHPSVGKDWQQCLSSQIMAISDTYDTLRTNRPYRSPLLVEEVLNNICQLKGAQFHSLLVDDFMNLMKQIHSEN